MENSRAKWKTKIKSEFSGAFKKMKKIQKRVKSKVKNRPKMLSRRSKVGIAESKDSLSTVHLSETGGLLRVANSCYSGPPRIHEYRLSNGNRKKEKEKKSLKRRFCSAFPDEKDERCFKSHRLTEQSSGKIRLPKGPISELNYSLLKPLAKIKPSVKKRFSNISIGSIDSEIAERLI